MFCVQKHEEQETLNPLDLLQWDFYILPTRVLNQEAAEQKTAALSSLIKMGAEQCEYENLTQRIRDIFFETE